MRLRMRNQNKINKLLIFDLDGTLVDSLNSIKSAGNVFMTEIGLPPITHEEARARIGAGPDAFICGALDSRGYKATERDVRRFAGLYQEYACEGTRAFPGADQALRTLLKAGVDLALCTNKPSGSVYVVLSAMRWDGVFEPVIAGDSLPEKKPNPAPLLMCLKACGIRAKDALMVGDSAHDSCAAEAAGIDFVLHEGGYSGSTLRTARPRAQFADFRVLPTLCLELLDRRTND